MRIQCRELENHLKRGLSSVYFVFGEEPLQRIEALDLIRTAARQQGFTDRTVFDITANFNWNKLAQSLETPSLFSDKKFIECHLQEGKTGKLFGELFTQILATLPEQTLLLVCGDKFEAATQKTKWFTALERQAITLCARPLSRTETLGWLQKKFSAVNLYADPDILVELYEYTEGNLLAAAQTIARLALNFPHISESPSPKSLTRADLLEQINLEARFSLFDLVDAILNRSPQRTLRILSCLKVEDVEPILVLWVITREVRVILKVAYAVQSGRPLNKVFEERKVWKTRTALISAYLKNIEIETLLESLIKAKNIDEVLKGRAIGDAWHALLELCIMLMGVRHAAYSKSIE
jgi:DNA polymerase-3 subunit delta